MDDKLADALKLRRGGWNEWTVKSDKKKYFAVRGLKCLTTAVAREKIDSLNCRDSVITALRNLCKYISYQLISTV